VRRVAIIASASGNGKTTLGRSLFGYALTQQPRRRREWPSELARYNVVRLRSQSAVEQWLERAS
jgi:ABC-type dipeptide/oligopeptide/nickel transport system ATPase subunit